MKLNSMKCGILSGQKKNKKWVWFAIDRKTMKIVGFTIGNRGKRSLTKLLKMIEKFNIKIYYTDGYKAYNEMIDKSKHIIGKNFTTNIESFNSLIRHYLARFRRRTRCYSKSLSMVYCTVLLFINKYNKNLC